MKLGDEAKSKISGVRGIITVTCRNLTGCDQVLIQPPYNNDKSEMPVGVWVDVMAVEVIKAGAVKIAVPPEVPDSG